METGEYDNFSVDTIGYRKVCEKIVAFSKSISSRDIIIIGENPYKSNHDLSYIDNLLIPKYFSNSTASSIFKPVEATFEINSYFDSFFANYTNISFINPANIFCEGEECLEQEKGKIYFSDKDHLSKMGSVKAIKAIEKKLLKYIVATEYIKPNQVVNHKSSKLNFVGWYNPEKLHRWSQGNSAEIKFKIGNKKEFKGEIEFNMGVYKNQEVKFLLNDSIIGEENLKGFKKILKISFNPSILNNTDNSLKFEFF